MFFLIQFSKFYCQVISELTAALKLYPLSQATEMISQRPKVITGNVKKLYDMMDRKAASDSDSPQLTPFAMLTVFSFEKII
jgi:hypothetical protein